MKNEKISEKKIKKIAVVVYASKYTQGISAENYIERHYQNHRRA